MSTLPKDKNESAFPRMVYRKGTGRAVNETAGLYEAEGIVVYDEKQLADLGAEACATPQEAAAGRKDAVAPVKPSEKK